MFQSWCRHHNFLLKFCKTWKNLVFVGKYNSPNDRSLQLLSTKPNFAHFVSFPLGGNVPIDLFWQNWGLLKALKFSKLEKANFAHFVGFPLDGNLLIDLFCEQSLLFQALKALELSKATRFVKQSQWVDFHQAVRSQNEQSLLFQLFKLWAFKSLQFCEKRSMSRFS